jgi:hypothetical protein
VKKWKERREAWEQGMEKEKTLTGHRRTAKSTVQRDQETCIFLIPLAQVYTINSKRFQQSISQSLFTPRKHFLA